MKKRMLALALAGIFVCSSAFTGLSVNVDAAETYVTVDQLQDNKTAAPAKDTVVPDANQYEYQKQELSAFCHFGPNTFNEIEWGEHYGSKAPDDIFKLEDNFDAETMVSTLKEAGFEKLIVTAKHHDGFCIWNSAYTTYDVESTGYADYNYDGMGGDVLAEISAACTKYDMDMGLYLSPWDIHEPSYGYHTKEEGYPDAPAGSNDAYDYNDYYNNQLEEILSNDKYGNAGHFNEVWMDGAKGSGANAQDYDFQRWFATIQKYEGIAAGYDADAMLFGAEAYTGVRWIGNESGFSNEETWSKSVANKTSNTINSNDIGSYTAGWSNGNIWTVPEADSRITSGWFWGNLKKTPATMTDLANRYFTSVGYNSTMLLNVPPNDKGEIDEAILARVVEFGQAVQETFANNKAAKAAVSATEVRGNDVAYSPANVLDGDASTYWTVEDGTASGSLVLDLGSVTTFDVVSIEESIEFGQRITSFKVETSTDGTNWTTMKEGSTVGAKRLVRTAPVKAQYVKITVATDDTDVYTSTSADTEAKGTVPMIAEVGVYKAGESFELASAAPDGMTVIDDRDSAFKFTGSWNLESGSQFPISQTGQWCNAGPSFTVTFTGSKIYLIGTIDPNHSTANVSVDGGTETSINTYNKTRMLGQIIYESEDLEYGEHTLTLKATGTIGIDGAYVIDNNGLGMIGIENAKYNMEEDEEIQVKLIRTGGSEGEVEVLLSPNPGSAIQDDYDTECITKVVFADGETEKYAPVRTTRNTNQTGDRYFTIELSCDNEDVILGFNSVARVTIKDAEGITVEKLQALVDEYTADVVPSFQVYTAESWTAFEAVLTATADKLEEGGYTASNVKAAYEALEEAKAALVARDTETGIYTAEDRFQFPGIDETTVLEMEYTERHNNEEGDNGWPLMITDNAWASNGKFLNCLNGNDQAVLHYNAPRKGTYSAVVTYRSGDPANSIVWSEADGKITEGSVSAGAGDGAGATHTAEFEFVVTEAGEGTLTFKGGDRKAPQIDKIEITAKDVERKEFTVTKNATGNGAIAGPDTVKEGESAEFTFTAEEGYVVKDVKVNGVSVGAVDSYTVEDTDADLAIEVVFGVKSADPEDDSKDIPTDQYTVTAGSTQPGNTPDSAIDGSTSSFWEVVWDIGNTNPEVLWYQIELDEAKEVDAVRYYPRWGGNAGSSNGFITDYRIEVSMDGENFKAVCEGSWEREGGWKIASFEPVAAKYIRLVATGTYADVGDNSNMSIAEIRVTGNADGTVTPPEPPVDVVNKDALTAAITAAEALNPEDYKDFSAVEALLAYAKNIAATETISQAEVDLAAEELNAAIEALVEKGDEPVDPPVVEEDEVVRLFGDSRYDTGYAVADALKEALGVEKFEAVVVATGKNFADALAGSYLAVEKNAPILLTNGKDDNIAELHAYIAANVAEGGKVYILGGEGAVPVAVDAIEGYEVVRLFGDSRYDTNLEILKEAGVKGDSIIVATGKTFADSLSASAAKLPILLVKPNATLNNAQKEVLTGMKNIYIVGGEGAVSAVTQAELAAFGEVTRVFGDSRYDTSVEVAKTFCKDVDFAVVASGKNFPDGLCGGPLAAALNAPLVLTKDGGASAAAAYVAENGIASGFVLGGDGALADETVVEVFALESAAEIK